METEVRATIRNHMHGKASPTQHDMLCFMGMIEFGAATLDDFETVGGIALRDDVARALRYWNTEHRDE